MRPRELPLVIVECCQRYVVSEQHPIPRCHVCEEIPTYLCDTAWWLEVE